MNKLWHYYKIGIRLSVVRTIAGLIVMLAFMFLVFGDLSLSNLIDEQKIRSISVLYWIGLGLVAVLADGFAVNKYRGWIFK